MDQWSSYLLLFGVGSVAGVLNVVAGGGSFLTLPVLIFLGLPPTLANGTNRVGVVLQNVGAVWSFRRHGMIDWSYLLWAALPAMVGAVLGSWVALRVGDELFQNILVFLMVAVTLWTLWDPLKKTQLKASGSSQTPVVAVLVAGFFLSGVYGGFVQAGVGFLILATTSLAGLDLVRGNAVKVLSVLCFGVVSLGMFAWQDKVDWWIGLALGTGMVLGGLVGVKLTVLKGHAWIKRVVTVTIIVFALRLWFGG
ncbi:MAG: sulfite exporter TauE/SafE family protein [Acidobacteria bacterium]|nr:sulfite exporter TauE/SafE family protein [Acidobacteriota bacterium]